MTSGRNIWLAGICAASVLAAGLRLGDIVPGWVFRTLCTLALGTIWLGVRGLAQPVARLAETYGAVFQLSGPDWRASAAIVAFAALLGWLGAVISVRRHLAGA